MTGVYVHIPFCVKKCGYCDFNSFDNIAHLKKQYKDRIIEEINAYDGDAKADTVFFGGGTPTSMETEDLLEIIAAVKNKFEFDNIEFSVEANPATVDGRGLLLLRQSGVNRLSIGLQSANDNELKALGRVHSFSQFLKTYEDAVFAGFDNINVDLMFGIPEQTIKSFDNTLKTVVALNPSHISCYSLIIEENTPFYNATLNLPDEDTEREMYYHAVDYFSQNGYNHYEISNFARDGKHCRHNIKYWERENYIGFGAGACSMINNVRIQNTGNVLQYINDNNPQSEYINKEDALAEHIFLGLRMIDGFNVKNVENIYNINFYEKYKSIIDKYVKTGYIEFGERLKLTRKGISVSNVIMSEFL